MSTFGEILIRIKQQSGCSIWKNVIDVPEVDYALSKSKILIDVSGEYDTFENALLKWSFYILRYIKSFRDIASLECVLKV